MRIGVLDGWSGVAGDMWVGAAIGAGADFALLEAAVRSLGLPGVTIAADSAVRAHLAGTRFRVLDGGHDADAPAATAHHEHRGLADITAIVERAELPAAVRDDCLAVYRAIAEVEAAAHATTVERVHFHEVGAVDAIVDVVCACLAKHLLGIERLVANGIAVGSGTVGAAHGVLPVPAPATAALLRGIPVRVGGLAGERTTPTGAALLRVLADAFDEPVSFTPDAIGYGAGARDDPQVPNLLRLTVGTSREATSATAIVELSCHLDTAGGELVGWLLDELQTRGAVDAFVTAIQMKKGRPGLLLTVHADEARAPRLEELLLEESTSLGVRRTRLERTVLERWQEQRETAFGSVRYKCARLPSGAVLARPEDDEVRRLCRETGRGRAELLRGLLGTGDSSAG